MAGLINGRGYEELKTRYFRGEIDPEIIVTKIGILKIDPEGLIYRVDKRTDEKTKMPQNYLALIEEWSARPLQKGSKLEKTTA